MRAHLLWVCVTVAAAAAALARAESAGPNSWSPGEAGRRRAEAAPAGWPAAARLRRRHLSAAPRLQARVSALEAAPDEALIELLAQLYAHTRLLQLRLEQQLLAEAPPASGGSGAQRGERMEALGLDERSLGAWLEERRRASAGLAATTFELVRELPNTTISVCPDGPKILVLLPNASDFRRCHTRDQWLEKLWLDLAPNYRQHYPIILLNLLVFLVGALGNVFVCLSVYRNHRLRNVTNYFIVNLAVADLLVILICLPATLAWDLTLSWLFGSGACKLVMFLQDVSVSVSVLTLAAISLDRYHAICHPLKFKSSLGQARRAIGAIWLASLLIMSPDLVYLAARQSQELRESGLETVLYSDCNYHWSTRASRAFQFIKTVLLYLVPLLLMLAAHYTIMRTLRAASAISVAHSPVYCSARAPPPPPPDHGSIMVTMHNRGQLGARRKAAKMLTAIVLIFGLCYLPVHLINFLRQFIDDIPQTEATSTLAMLAHCLCYLNSAINPIIYNHMNSVFRAEFRRSLAWCLCCLGGGLRAGGRLSQPSARRAASDQTSTALELGAA